MIERLLAAESDLALGQLDRAERAFRQVLAADPRNPIAAVGLARVALERGDEADVAVLARDALAIDPENAAARRLVDRTEDGAGHGAAAGASPAPARPTAATTAAAEQPAPTPRPAPVRRSLLRRLLRRS